MVTNPIIIYFGNANFRDSKITDLGNLKSIGGDAYFSYSNVTTLGNLKSIGGDANFRDSKVTTLGNLISIGGYADFSYKDHLKKQWEERYIHSGTGNQLRQRRGTVPHS